MLRQKSFSPSVDETLNGAEQHGALGGGGGGGGARGLERLSFAANRPLIRRQNRAGWDDDLSADWRQTLAEVYIPHNKGTAWQQHCNSPRGFAAGSDDLNDSITFSSLYCFSLLSSPGLQQ